LVAVIGHSFLLYRILVATSRFPATRVTPGGVKLRPATDDSALFPGPLQGPPRQDSHTCLLSRPPHRYGLCVESHPSVPPISPDNDALYIMQYRSRRTTVKVAIDENSMP
jgi:hypothetical protein